MTGASTTPFIVSAYMKGSEALILIKPMKNAQKCMPGGIMSKVGYEHYTNKGGGIEYYIDRGYVPFPCMKTIWLPSMWTWVQWSMHTRIGHWLKWQRH